MTDFDYDVMQKKRIASGDRYRKRGSKSKCCSLPSDHLTQAQWKKRNGKVKTMNLNEPMNWMSFKGMPEELQVEYVHNLVDRFHCTMADLSLVFNVKSMAISRRFKEIGVAHLFQRGKKMTPSQRKAFTDWLNGSDTAVPDAPQSDPAPQSKTTSQPEKVPGAIPACQRMDMTWSGDVNLLSVLELVHQFTDGHPVYLRVIAEKEAVHEPF